MVHALFREDSLAHLYERDKRFSVNVVAVRRFEIFMLHGSSQAVAWK